jgi:hypothetical protein
MSIPVHSCRKSLYNTFPQRFGERCSLISNAMRQTARSYNDAMLAIETALEQVRGQLRGLEERQKTGLASYRSLVLMAEELSRKKKELLILRGDGP